MSKRTVNTKVSNQIYLLINLLHLLFVIYFVVRELRFIDPGFSDSGRFWILLIGFLIVSNLLAVYAKRKGGVINPVKGVQLARILQTSAIIFFMAGIILPALFRMDYQFRYVSALSIPLYIAAIFYAHKDMISGDDSDLLDDFEIGNDGEE
ncbi:MAG: hypothetical protein ACPG21_09550 [Crocinitomicaceae bacterium]